MKFLIIIALTLMSFITNAQFRNTTWGMSLNEVKSIEKEKLYLKLRSGLNYKFMVEDMHCSLLYSFNDKDQLISIIYTFSKANRIDEEKILETTIKNIINKYGDPTESKKGYSAWNTDRFSIRAVLNGYSGVDVIYTPPAPSQEDIL